MHTPESKVAEQLVNLMESHWFNSAIFGRYMADQPYFTVDRTMEMVTQMITYIARRAEHEQVNNRTSDGLRLAVELDSALRAIKELQDFDNLRLPKTVSELTKTLPKVVRAEVGDRSWVRDRYTNDTQMNVMPVL